MKIIFLMILFFTNILVANTVPFKIAIANDMFPYTFVDENGEANGILVDYWKLWAKKSDQKIVFVPSTWEDTLKNINNKKVDIHSGLYMNEERKKSINFLKPIYNSTVNIYINIKDKNKIKEVKDLNNKFIGIIAGTHHIYYMKKNYPNIKIKIYNTYAKLLSAIIKGEVDSFIEDSLIASIKLIQSLKMNKVINLIDFKYEQKFYSGITKNNKKLELLVLNGINKITVDDIIEIEKKWIFDDSLKYYQKQKELNLLTEEEKLWLQKNPLAEFAVVKNWNLFSFIDSDGKLIGFHLDLLNQINKNLNTKLTYKAFINWEKAYDAAKNKEVDGIFGLSWDKEREKYFKFSPVYHYSPYNIVTRNDRNDIKTISDFKGKRIASEKNDLVNKSILALAPNAKIIFKEGVTEILKSIKNKVADAALISYAEKENVEKYNLKIGEFVEINSGKLAVGVDKNKILLSSIINKGINSITKKQMNVIEERWLNKNKSENIFTEEELKYFKNSPKLKIALENWKPIIFSENGKIMGIAGEIIFKAIEKSNLKFEYVVGKWSNLLNDFKMGKIDVLPTVAYSKKREGYGLFSNSYLNLNNFLYVKKSNNHIKSLKDLEYLKLAIVSDFAYIDSVEEKFPNIKIVKTTDLKESIKKVLNGEVDAFFATQVVVQNIIKELMITNLKEISQNGIEPFPLHMLSKKNDPILQSILNKLIRKVSREEKNKIISKWINQDDNKRVDIDFSYKEKKYIKEHPYITFSEINWRPLSIIEDGKFNGIIYDYMKIIENMTGMKFKYVPAKTWDEVLEKFKTKKIDFMPSVNNTVRNYNLGLLSNEYVNFDFAIVSHNDGIYVRGIEDLRGRVLAIPKNFTSYNMIKSKYPGIQIIETKDLKEALTLVSQKKAYAFVGHSSVVLYNLKNNFSELKVIGLTEEKFYHHFLVQQTDPELLSIVNKIISSISIEDKLNIQAKWVKNEINTALDYSIIHKIIFVFSIILIIILIFMQKLSIAKKEIEVSSSKLEDLLENLKHTQKKLIESEKMASLGGLVAGVAHEINTPVGIGLTGITHFLHITEEITKQYKINNLSKEEFEIYLDSASKIAIQINANLVRTAELVKSFKQISVDQTHEEIREFNVKNYLDEILLSINNILKKTNLEVNITCDDNLKIKIYPGAFSQIITNLIINSIRHGYKEKEKGKIAIKLYKEDDNFKLIYTDDGKGISKDNLPKIFDPFFTTNREHGGTGLGLNIIYNIVSSKLQGTIICNSQKDMGVEFIIEFKGKEE